MRGGALSFSGERLGQELDQAAQRLDYPESISCDNGPEFCSRAFDRWAHLHLVRDPTPVDYPDKCG
jgi:hypothetical protein